MTKVVYQLVVKNVRSGQNDGLTDLAIANGKIAAIQSPITGSATQAIDADGKIVLPGFVDSHIHLDKALTAERFPNRSGTLTEAIQRANELARDATREDFYVRAHRTAEWALRCGTTTLRTHVNVSRTIGLRGIHALLDLREEMRGRIDIQIVAFARRLSGREAKRERELVAAALEDGADAIGGSSRATTDPEAFIDAAFRLATTHDKPLDLHVDESDSPEDFLLPYLAKRTLAEGFDGRVVAGHCCSLAYVDEIMAARTIEQVARAKIVVVTLPATNLYLQGRQETPPVSRGITRVKELIEGGVNVVCGSDNIRDMFNPFGRPDLLLMAHLLGHVAQMGGWEQQNYLLESISTRAADALGISSGLQPGAPGDIILVGCHSYRSLLANLPKPSCVIKGGRMVVDRRPGR